MNLLRQLASLKFTLFGMALLSVGSMAIYGNPMDVPSWVLTIPLVMLAVNLTAAIITNVRINQQPGLLVFHVSLLSLVILAGIGRLTYLDSHVELAVGEQFSPDNMLDLDTGVFHSNLMENVVFEQGPFTVNYAPGIQRELTFSNIKVRSPSGQWEDKVIGDDRPLVMQGYRFYTTHNKGFSAVLTWTPDTGEPQTGTVNMPSFPLFDYKQDNRWVPPNSDNEIKFWLQLKTGMDAKVAWILSLENSSGVLVVTHKDRREELQLGESIQLADGNLRFEQLSMWMGYRIFYDPTIQWMFFVSVAGVLGLGQYFWKKLNLQPWMSVEESDTDAVEHLGADDISMQDGIQESSVSTQKGPL